MDKVTNLLAGVIAQASGQPMDEYLAEHLFAPLGIEPGKWHRDEAGNPHAMAGLPLTARDAARLGQLLLDDGRLADGTRLLPEGFVEELFAPSARSERVGLLWWRVPEWQRVTLDEDAVIAYRADGYLGQYIVVVPEQRMVAVRQIQSRESEGTHPPDSDYPGFSSDVITLAQALSGETP